jgi:hypothetical protein
MNLIAPQAINTPAADEFYVILELYKIKICHHNQNGCDGIFVLI